MRVGLLTQICPHLYPVRIPRSLLSFTSGDPNSYAPWSCEGDYAASFTATAIAPINGMFVGTLQTSAGATDQLAINVSQSGYAVSASGTATGATLSVASGNTTVVGALLYGSGSATNANGTEPVYLW